MMIKRNKIPTILGIILLITGVFAGVFLLKENKIFRIGASPTTTPKNIRIGSISDTSATISWFTEDKTVDFISYGTSQNVGNVINESEEDKSFNTHNMTLTGLEPETLYYFKINSDGKMFDNNGNPWQFTTGKALNTSQINLPISGSVLTSSGEPSKRALVYVIVNGYTISTITSDSGTFVLQLGSVRTPDLRFYAQIDSTKTLLEISAVSETGETATAKIFPKAANPIPALIVGKDQDFRSLEAVTDGNNPNADLEIPTSATSESRFNVDSSKADSSSTVVTLESISDGEIITSDTPEFFGDGPKGTNITISVHSSKEIAGTTKVAPNGSWNWVIPSNLSPGEHSITISWIDVSGITRTITRNFIVQAGELPAFVATPTATPKTTSTPIPTKSATPTLTVKPTTSATVSASPKVTKTPSPIPASLPKSGSLTPTILMSIMGLGLLIFSFYVWKKSEY